MNQSHVTSLLLSKRLKELGVPQESLFVWLNENPTAKHKDGSNKFAWGVKAIYTFRENYLDYLKETQAPNFEWYSAFLASEVGEMLPEDLNEKVIENERYGELSLTIWKFESKWQVNYLDEDQYPTLQLESDTEAEARGLMLAYLYEHNLLPPVKGLEEA